MEPDDTITVAQAQNLIEKSYRQGVNASFVEEEHRKPPINLSEWYKSPFDLPDGAITGEWAGMYIGIMKEGDSHS